MTAPSANCTHCGWHIEALHGRWVDRTESGWCAGKLLPHTPAPQPDDARQSDPLLTSGGLR